MTPGTSYNDPTIKRRKFQVPIKEKRGHKVKKARRDIHVLI